MNIWLYPFLCLLSLSACDFGERSVRPNIVFVMVDDLGYSDLSSFGNENFSTPNIDRFVSEGLKFTNAYAASPFCSPTRVALMTGKYPAKFEIGLREPLTLSKNDLELGLSPEIPTLTSLMKNNNYETALFGKWHLGQTEKYLPAKHGIDHYFGILCGAADHIDHKPFDRNRDLLFKKNLPNLYENEKPVTKKGYLNNLITDYSIDFIKKRHNSPFFLSIQFTAPHWPWQGPTDSAVDSVSYSSSSSSEVYESMIKNLDENFGKLMDAIKSTGLEESTMVIFTNDNGGARFANQGKLKGLKGSLNEGGIRVPAAVRWPIIIPANASSDQAIITMDWTKTILEVTSSDPLGQIDSDGINLMEFLSNPKKKFERTLFWRITNRKKELAIRKGDFKYLRNMEGEFLYDLSNDIEEQRDLKFERPEILKKLLQDLELFQSQVLDPD